ncbi:hypothetical protein K435DRAFT_706018 [Dendrothele bispora CBS 962.96]|uniref:MULE transposase domain-containing protein n=1 Tax=Dendrothele bispora (strain CBS 962.96) TaxID=1314807 RepID=A0A4S8KKG5_DENBC|nr:hypothetical protein K435DRAFT_706018 [Dendrothele bispora CBS 962.96]
MDTFDCDGWLYIVLSDTHDRAHVQLRHGDDHVPYCLIDVPAEVKEYVQKNIGMTTSARILLIHVKQLWSQILQDKPHLCINFGRRSIYTIVANEKRKKWRRDDNELTSAKIILEESSSKESGSLYTVEPVHLPQVYGYFGLAFSLPKVIAKWGGCIREISLDSAWNTNGSRYELYALLGETYGSGCPLGFFLLQSPKNGEEGTKEKYIAAFLEHFQSQYKLDPKFTLSDKDLSELNAFRKVFPMAKHQLCFWHALRAVKTRLSILCRHPKFYDVNSLVMQSTRILFLLDR